MGNLNFDATTVDPDTGGSFDPLPPGWYQCSITAAELVESSNSDAGEMLKVTFEIDANVHPDHNGRVVSTWLCKDHKKQQVRDIARRQMSAIGHAIDVLQLEDTTDLLGGELMVRLKIRPAKGEYDASNDASGYAAVGEKPPVGSAPTKKPTRAPARAEEPADDGEEAEEKPKPKGRRNGKPAWK